MPSSWKTPPTRTRRCLPEESVRAERFAIHLARRELGAGRFDLPALATASEGFSGAEIEQAIVVAVYAAAARQESLGSAELIGTLEHTSPLSVVMAERIDALRDWAQGRAVMAG